MEIAETPNPTPEQLERRAVRVKALAHALTLKLLSDIAECLQRKKTTTQKKEV